MLPILAALLLAAPAPARPAYETIYVAMCRDKPDGLKIRYGANGVIGAHLDYIDSIRAKVAIGGPSREMVEGKPKVHGAVIAYHAADLAEAKALLANDPLMAAIESCQWDSVSAYVGTYVGGWAGPYTPKAR